MKPTIDLSDLSDQALVSLNYFFAFDYPHRKTDRESADTVINSVCVEADKREWPEGWYEDPSVIPSIGAVIEAAADRHAAAVAHGVYCPGDLRSEWPDEGGA